MLKKEIKPIIQKLLLGFAAGVLIAASVWSLLIPSIEMAETQGKPAWLPASVGFMIGIVTLIGVNNLAEKIEKRNNKKNECAICDDIENLLTTEENDEKIIIKNKEKLKEYPLGSQDGKLGNSKVIAKFFNPTEVGTWYIIEGKLSELESIQLPKGKYFKRDILGNE